MDVKQVSAPAPDFLPVCIHTLYIGNDFLLFVFRPECRPKQKFASSLCWKSALTLTLSPQNLTPGRVLEMRREEDNIYDRFTVIALSDESRIVGRVPIQFACLFAKFREVSWKTRIKEQGSRIKNRGSRIEDRGSGIGDRGSGIGDLLFSFAFSQ